MRKEICASKTNSIVANNKAIQAVTEWNNTHKMQLETASSIQVCRVILSSSATGFSACKGKKIKRAKNSGYLNPSGVPLLCFVKKLNNNKLVIVGIESGKAEIVDRRRMAIKEKNMQSFTINGVQYGIFDRLNDMPRFKALNQVHVRHKLSLHDAEVQAALTDKELDDEFDQRFYQTQTAHSLDNLG